jgi:methionyl aminopeptidase
MALLTVLTRMIEKRTPKQIDEVRAAGQVVIEALQLIGDNIQPGIRTIELDAIAEDFIRSRGATPTCKGYHGYPASICASPNDLVVHGIPGPRELRDGDIITIDLAVTRDGWVADAARTFPVGAPTRGADRLLRASELALYAGIERCRAGLRLGDVSHAIQQTAERGGFTVLRTLRGHGIGRRLHEEPAVPNYGEPGTGLQLEEGMVLAVEPMLSAGRSRIRLAADGWAVFTADGALAAHSEFTVAIGPNGPHVLTPW